LGGLKFWSYSIKKTLQFGIGHHKEDPWRFYGKWVLEAYRMRRYSNGDGAAIQSTDIFLRPSLDTGWLHFRTWYQRDARWASAAFAMLALSRESEKRGGKFRALAPWKMNGPRSPAIIGYISPSCVFSWKPHPIAASAGQ
jgi:hypothetical protein